MRLVLAAAVALVWFASPLPTYAADLHVLQKGHYGPTTTRYFGKYEPWSRRSERPPRRGRLLREDPVPRTVNALVPMRGFHGRPTPWTQAWFAYCAARWPSFNPKTGTIRTPDGVRMCM